MHTGCCYEPSSAPAGKEEQEEIIGMRAEFDTERVYF